MTPYFHDVLTTVSSPQPNRHSIRLPGYDYSQAGAYFVTICSQNRECIFGNIVDGTMRLNQVGQKVADEWIKTAEIRDDIALDEWIVMPNHFHGILAIANCQGTARHAPMWNNSVARYQVRFQQLFDHSNPVQPNASTQCANPPAQKYGNAIIGNTSSVTKRNWNASGNISATTHCNGNWINCIQI